MLLEDDGVELVAATVEAVPEVLPAPPAPLPVAPIWSVMLRSSEVGPGRTGASLGFTDRLMAEWGTKAPGVL